jgi:ATP-dependent DNA helicase 2 subunit 2
MGNTLRCFSSTGLTRFLRNRSPWYDTRLSYNPPIHRMKQALFHGAIVQDLAADPLPPPHPELTKYFEPPKNVLKRAKGATDDCKTAFAVKKGVNRFNAWLTI